MTRRILTIVVLVLLSTGALADHLGNLDLSNMKIVLMHGVRDIHDETAPEYYCFYFDRISGNYYIEYGFNMATRKYEVALYEPTNKVSPRVDVGITRTETSKLKYNYTVANDGTAKQAIFSFTLTRFDTDLTLSSVDVPVQWEFFDAYRTSKEFGVDELRWDNTKSEMPELRPGKTVSGFGLESNFLPGIVRSYFEGFEIEKDPIDGDGLSNSFPIEPSDQMSESLKAIDNDTNKYVFVTTIGATKKPPSDPSVLRDTFILDLISQVREAVTAGWIKHDLRKDRADDDDHSKRKGAERGEKKGFDKDDEGEDGDDLDTKDKGLPGAAKSIIKKLAKVRHDCLRGRFAAAREKLHALIKQVSAQRGKHLTDESYALIKFNAEFLLEKI